MKFTPTEIADVVLLEPRKFSDNRGYFMEAFKLSAFHENVDPDVNFVQDNQSFSVPAGTVRALHFQAPPHAQGKLVRCTKGAIIDVAVDIRKGSPTFGQHVRVELSAENAHQLWVPAGFLHGFSTLQDNVEVMYKVTDYYAPECDGNVLWNDTDLNIDWGIDENRAELSDKDKKAPKFADFDSPFSY